MKLKLSIAIFATLLLAGCGANNASNKDTSSSQPATSQSSSTTQEAQNESTTLKDVKVTLSQAVTAFRKAYAGKTITDLSVDQEMGQYQYEVSGVDNQSEYKLVLDAMTGKTIHQSKEALDADEQNGAAKNDALNLKKVVGLQRAIQIGQFKASGKTPTEASLDQDRGTTYWEVQYEKNHDETTVKVNAQTGQVLEVEHDD